MKRQRGASVNSLNNLKNPPNVEDVVATMEKKKGKKEEDEEQKVSMVMEKNKEILKEMGEETSTITREGVNSNNVMSWNNREEYMPSWLGGGSIVDEQMSWGSTWFPGWDMDFMMSEAFNSLYSDVVWDDDIWNLKNEIPIPLHGKKFELE
ncbi:uncharacterized protein LOC131609994 [Vicia villosa]|uniref:uncharacterized protein LOC131609994 n=1 Tax=Vicia villosa TaxID=3911 RepID=UPI00273B3EAE|nr:uncharacterized protein LOC131609994 [Vicia villosa]